MSALPVEKRYTPAEYLALEEVAATKSEYINGRIYAMVGASFPHIVITGNTFREIGNRLETSDCEAYTSDMRVKIGASGSYVYPDITISCGEQQFDSTGSATLLNPTVIIEVLSPSTEAFDRGDKFAHYRLIPSLQEYVLISQHRVCVELFSRDIARGETVWSYSALEDLEAVLHLASIGCYLPLRAIYRKVEFPHKEAEKESEKDSKEENQEALSEH